MALSAPTAHTELFRFSSHALPDEALHVIRFTGQEGLNELFSFSIQLVSRNLALDTGKLLSDRATFRIIREDGSEAVFSGYPAAVEQQGAFNGYAYYTVELRPALWKLTRIVQSYIFLNQTLNETIAELLRSQTFFSFSHQFEFTRNDYPRREFAMQYEESIYNYLLWRLEDQGAYYYFSQTEDTLHFADSPVSHQPLEHTSTLRYAPPSGLEGGRIGEVLTSFALSQTQLPAQVVIRSYSWQNPNKPIVGTAAVSDDGLGDVYLTGEDVESDAEAERLAKIRAEELICHARNFHGAGSVPGIRPGYTFRLAEHYNPAFNRDYLVTKVLHEGSQESFINLGLGIPLESLKEHLFYRNRFTCIEAGLPYRPTRTAPRTKISGVIHAFIDGASDGSRPEIDEYGRYKLMFPFDISGRTEGKATCWIRRAQEQVGKNSGMSFPLLPGVEVLISFVDGNPDRPYITGALANAETGALTGSANSNFSGISTPGGSSLVFKDSGEKQGFGMVIPSGSGIVMGAGSLPAGAKDCFYWVDTAAVSTSFSTLGQNMSSCYKIAQSTGFERNPWISGVFGAVAGTFGGVASSLRERKDGIQESADWSLEMIKMASLFFQTVVDCIGDFAPGGAASTPYAYSVSASEGGSKALLQSYPSKGKLIAGLVLNFIAKAGSSVAAVGGVIDAFDRDTDKDKTDAENGATQEDNKDAANSRLNSAEMALDTAKTDKQAKEKEETDAQTNLDQAQTAVKQAETNGATQEDKKQFSIRRDEAQEALNTATANKLAAEQKEKEAETEFAIAATLANVIEAAEAKRTEAQAKKKAIVSYKTQSIAKLVPEIVALITLLLSNVRSIYKAGGSEGKWGGVLLTAPESNINLRARDAIGLHSEHGILIEAGDRLQGKLKELYDGDVKERWGSKDTKDTAITVSDLFNFGVPAALENTDIQSSKKPFLADSADVRYTDAAWQIANIDKTSKTLASRHILVSSTVEGKRAAQAALTAAQAALTDAQAALTDAQKDYTTAKKAFDAAPHVAKGQVAKGQVSFGQLGVLERNVAGAQENVDKARAGITQAEAHKKEMDILKDSSCALVIQNGDKPFVEVLSADKNTYPASVEKPGNGAPGIFAIAKDEAGVQLETKGARILLDAKGGCRVEAKQADSSNNSYGLLDDQGIQFKSLGQSLLQMNNEGLTLKVGDSLIKLEKDTITLKTPQNNYVIGNFEIDAENFKNKTGTFNIQGKAIVILPS